MNELVKRDQHQITPIIPRNYEEVFKMAEQMASTQMVPKDYQGKKANVIVAIQMGMELGLLPMQAIQNIAVINGRPCVWGDAQIALVRGSGHLEWMKETQDDKSATCEVKRHGDSNPVKQTFSIEDAKKAGLLDKPGPWKQYPKRMLQMRARGFALRDLFPDVLKGIISREEAQDIIDVEVVAPSNGDKKTTTIRETGSSTDNLDALKEDPKPEESKPDEQTGETKTPIRKDQDDIPIDGSPEEKEPELIGQEQFSAFLAKSRDLKIVTKDLVAFVKKNGFADAERITVDKYELMMQGLEEIAKK